MALTPKQTQELAGRLEARRRQLLEELGEDAERAQRNHYGEVGGPAADPGDESVADLASDMDHAEVSRDLGELRDVDAARARIADGTYGTCVECGAEIPYERLRANPAAARDLACQARFETTHAGERPTL